MSFDPKQFIAEYNAQPAAEGVPDLLARPNAGNVPDYTADPPPAAQHDEVKPAQAAAVRAEIAKVTSAPGFHEMPPAAQQSAIIDAVHAVTRAAGAAIPFGHVVGAGVESMPVIGNGHSYRENLDALDQGAADARAAHPVASMIGTTAGLGATVAASGGFGTPGATMPAASPGLARLVAPVGANAAVGGIQGAGETAARGGSAGDVLRDGANGAMAGATVGMAIPSVAALRAGGANLLRRGVAASDSAMLKEVGDGAPKVQRFKLNDRGDDVVDLIRRTPALEKAHKNPSEFATAAGTELGRNGRELDSIYEAADKGGKIDPAGAVAAISRVQKGLSSDLAGEEVATALQPTIDKLDRRAGTMQPIGSSELRREITRLQDIAFKKGPGAETTTVQAAAKAAASALKDVLEEHVHTNLPGQLDRVRELNNDQTLLSRIKGAADYKVLNKPNENTSRLTVNLHKVADKGAHGLGLAGIAMGAANGKNIPEMAGGAALMAAPHVIPAVATGVREGTAAVGRKLGIGGDGVSLPSATAQAASGLAQRLVQAKANPGQLQSELMAHVFGRADAHDDIPEPETMGVPPEKPAGDEPETLTGK